MFVTQSMDPAPPPDKPWSLLARRGVLLLAGLAIVASVACGGDDKKSDGGSGGSNTPAATATSSSGSGSSSATATPSSSSGSGSPSATATPSSSSSGGSSSGSSGAAKLDAVNSYRYTVHMEGTGTGGPLAGMRDSIGSVPGQNTPTANEAITFDVNGAYVKPDKAQYTIKIGSFQVGQTVIGNQEWTTFGGVTSGPSPSTSSTAADLSLIATIFDEDFSNNVANKTNCADGKETVNGVPTRKCSLDKAGLEKLDTQLGGFFEDTSPKDLKSFQLDLWNADPGGYPVKMTMELSGKDTDGKDYGLKVEMNLTDINKSIEIKAPK